MLVKITDGLKSDVRTLIDNMASKESVPDIKIDLDKYEGVLDAAYWKQHAHLKQQMPKEWKESFGHVKLSTGKINGAYRVTRNGQDVSYYAPPNTSQWEHRLIAAGELVDLLHANADAKRAHREKWDAVKDKIIKFLEQFPSLNQAIESWNGVRLYVPEDYIKRVEAKPAKRAKVVVAPTDELHQLTAIAVAQRLAA